MIPKRREAGKVRMLQVSEVYRHPNQVTRRQANNVRMPEVSDVSRGPRMQGTKGVTIR